MPVATFHEDTAKISMLLHNAWEIDNHYYMIVEAMWFFVVCCCFCITLYVADSCLCIQADNLASLHGLTHHVVFQICIFHMHMSETVRLPPTLPKSAWEIIDQ